MRRLDLSPRNREQGQAERTLRERKHSPLEAVSARRHDRASATGKTLIHHSSVPKPMKKKKLEAVGLVPLF
jgi:hypothetical protein